MPAKPWRVRAKPWRVPAMPLRVRVKPWRVRVKPWRVRAKPWPSPPPLRAIWHRRARATFHVPAWRTPVFHRARQVISYPLKALGP